MKRNSHQCYPRDPKNEQMLAFVNNLLSLVIIGGNNLREKSVLLMRNESSRMSMLFLVFCFYDMCTVLTY